MENQQLIDFIKQSRQTGKSDSQIREELLGAGWQEAVISKLLSVTNSLNDKKPHGIKPWIINTLIISVVTVPTFFFSVLEELVPIVVFISAVWVYTDAKKLNIEQYKKTPISLSTTPRGAAVLVLLFWLITFPMYITFRYRIINGRIPLKEEE